MNECMNYEAVYRTAPATPGLLIIGGHQNCITGSRVAVILLNAWTLPIGEAALGRVGACSLHSRFFL